MIKPLLTSLLFSLTSYSALSQCTAPVTGLLDLNPTDIQISLSNGGIIEWGPLGYTPGNGAAAGAGGTLLNCLCATPIVNGLNPGTTYDLYARMYCGSPGYSANSARLRFTTPPCPETFNYATLNSTLTIYFGETGYYEYYSNTGTPDRGVEKIVKFTPAASGYYDLFRRRPVSNFSMGSLMVRTANNTCNFWNSNHVLTGYQPVYPYSTQFNYVNGVNYTDHEVYLGHFNAGTTYDLFFDANDTTPVSAWPPINYEEISIAYVGCNITPTDIYSTANPVCAGTTVTLSVNGGAPAPGGNFKWYSGSCGGTLIGTGASISVSPSATTTYYVRAEANCGNSSCISKVITVQNGSVATPGAISGPAKICPGASGVTYSVAPVANASTYTWTAPAGVSIYQGQGTNTIKVNVASSFVSGTLSVKAGNACSTSGLRNKSLSRDIPGTPSAITGQTYGVCSSAKTYTINPTPNATTYQWTVPPGVIINNGQGTTSLTITFPGNYSVGTLSVKAGNYCGFGSARNLTVRGVPSTPVSITGPSTACANQQGVGFSTAAVAGASSYSWTVPSGALITAGQGSTSITMNFGSSGGNVRVRGQNSCGAGTYRTKAVTINCREGISDVNDLTSILIFPNPSKDVFMIDVGHSTEKFSLIMRDVIGRVVIRHENILNPMFEFGKELKSGVYFVEVMKGDNRKVIRVIKNN